MFSVVVDRRAVRSGICRAHSVDADNCLENKTPESHGV
jgi:hypothetical protein